MPTTEATGRQILDGSIGRADLNTTTSGSALIRKLIAGTNIGISYTGVDSGTGDVTVNLLATIGVNLGGTGAVTLTGLLKGNGTSPFTAAVAGTDYQAPITLTTTGTSGPATFVSNVLNIPNYATGGGGVATMNRTTQTFTATASQTTFTISGGYTVGMIDVFLNGARLTGVDYTATTTTTVVLAVGAAVGDILDVLIYSGVGITLTTTGSSGAATYNPSTGVFNIPIYAGGGGMVYPGAGIALSTGSAWGTSITDNSANWNTAYTNRITSLTTTGTSGAATLIGNVLNIPQYSGGGGGFTWTNTLAISAAGANQAAATLLTTKLNDVQTVSAGTGVRLPAATVSDYISVINHGANPLLIYPATGETVEGLAANAPLTLLEGQSYDAGCAVAGAWVGINVNVYDDENLSISLPLHGSQPPTPIAGIRIFDKNVGGRQMISAIGPSGIDYPFQPHFGLCKFVRWSPLGNGTTIQVDNILAPTALGTATARNVATTNILTRARRLGYVSAATAGAFAGHFFLAGAQQFTIGDGAGLGGFHYIIRFGVSDAAAVTGARQFIGWRNIVTTPTNVDPAAQTNAFGLAQISTDNTQWYITYGGSAAQTAVALGTTIGAPTLVNTVWQLSLFCSPLSNNTVKYTLTNLSTNVTVSGVLTGTAGTALPASTAFLAPIAWRTNNATLLAVGLDIISMTIDTDI